MPVAAFEHILHNDGGPLAPGQSGHDRGLRVGGKAGVGRRANGAHALEQTIPADGDVIGPATDPAARLRQHGGDRR